MKLSLFHFHFWKIFSLHTEFYVDGLHLSSKYIQLLHCLLVFIASDNSLPVLVFLCSLNFLHFFSLTALKSFSLSCFQQLNFDVCWCGFLYVSFLWGSLTFLDMWVYSFCHIYNILVIISSTFSVTSLFWVSNYTMLDCLILSHRLWMHCSFCKNLFISILHFWVFSITLSLLQHL